MTSCAWGCVQKCEPVGVTKKGKKRKKLSYVKLAICPDHPRRHSPLKFCLRGRVQDLFTYLKYHENRLRGLGAVGGGQKSPSPADKAHSTACITVQAVIWQVVISAYLQNFHYQTAVWNKTKMEQTLKPVRDNDNLKSQKYVCITTYQPDTKSNPNANLSPNPISKQHAIVNIELNIVTCPTYPDKFVRDNVVAPSVPTSVVIVTLPTKTAVKRHSQSRLVR